MIIDLKEESYIAGIQIYKIKFFPEVKVITYNNQFKRYSIEYTGNGTNYQFAGKITEYNANNEAANPLPSIIRPWSDSSYAEYTAEPKGALY